MSSSEMSIADPGMEITYFVIVRFCGCEFRNWVFGLTILKPELEASGNRDKRTSLKIRWVDGGFRGGFSMPTAKRTPVAEIVWVSGPGIQSQKLGRFLIVRRNGFGSGKAAADTAL